MSNFQEFWDSLNNERFLLILGILFWMFHIAVLIYRSILLLRKQNAVNQEEGVSVIITCANKAELLKQNLEAFLEQDYSKFEIIVIDECSEDDSQEVLAAYQKKYPRLKTSRIFPGTKFRCTKKIAIHIGVLAATHDILLFSEINARPVSRNWIRTMQSYFDQDTAAVIGYSNYATENLFAVRCYFRFIWFWQTFVLLKHGMTVMGNGYNMGYRKKYYLEKRGFSGNTQEYIGYDTEIIKEVSQKGKIKVIKEKEARMLILDDDYKTWRDDISYYYATKARWPKNVWLWSHTDFMVEMLCCMVFLYFIIFNSSYGYFILLLCLTLLLDLIVINICLKRLGLKKLFITSLIINSFGFVYKGYYNVYSIFTKKKWR